MAVIKKDFKVLNIKCSGCANSVKKALKDDFNDIKIDLSVTPRVITIQTDEKFDEMLFRKKMKKLGYPLCDEKIGRLEGVGVKAKSFISCAVGKMDQRV